MQKTKLFLMLATVIIVSVIVPQMVFAAWWNPFSWQVWNIFNIFSKPQTSIVQPNQNTNQVKNPPVQPSKDQTAGWKTFINTKYGIEVKYPAGWTAKNAVVGCLQGDPNYAECADGIGRGITLTSTAPYDPLTNPTNITIFLNPNTYTGTCSDKITIGTKVFCRQIPDLVSYRNRILQETSDILTGKYTAGPYFNDALLIKYTEMSVSTNKQLIEADLLIYDFGMEIKKNTENQYQQTKTIPSSFSADSILIKSYESKINQTDKIVQSMISTLKFINPVTNQTAGWKITTVSDNNHKFSIQYPSDWITESLNKVNQSPLFRNDGEFAFCAGVPEAVDSRGCAPMFHIEMPNGSGHSIALYALDATKVQAKYGQSSSPNVWVDSRYNIQYELVRGNFDLETPNLTSSENNLMNSVIKQIGASFKLTK